MGYVVDYKRMQFLYQQFAKTTNRWKTDLANLQTNVTVLIATDAYEGDLASSMKNYLKEVHLDTEGLLLNIISDYFAKLTLYWNGYLESIDSGTNAYMSEEVLRTAASLLQNAVLELLDISDEISNALSPIQDLFPSSAPSTEKLEKAMEAAEQIAKDLNESIVGYEEAHKTNDFTDMDDLISQVKTLIARQLGSEKRLSIDSYKPGLVAEVIDYAVINTAIQNMQDYQTNNEEAFKKALERIEEYTQQVQEEREWVQWVAVGVAIVGSVAMAVAFVSAGPLVCVAVGATKGLVNAAVGHFADNYVENGYLTSGMDWFEFGKDCAIGTVSGAIEGYAGAVAHGTSVVQPLQRTGNKVVEGLIKNTAEAAIDTAFDVGEAIVKDRPGEEIKSILADDFEEFVRKAASEAVSDAASTYVSSVHSADASDKTWYKKIGENMAETTVEQGFYTATDSTIIIGEGLLGIKDEDEVHSALLDNGKNLVTGLAKGYVRDFAGGLTDNAIDDIDNAVGKGIAKGIEEGASSAAGDFASGAARQRYEAATSGEEYKFDAKDIWENDMKGGTSAVKDAFNEGFKTGYNETDDAKAAKFKKQMDYYDRDGDKRIETVNVGEYRVAKEEYDAAQKMAGKEGYEGKTAAEILGVDKNTDIKRQYSFDAGNLKKYESKDSSANAAGQPEKSDSKKIPTNVVKLETK